MIYKKLHQIQVSVRSLLKDQNAFNYTYVTGNKLLAQVRPRMDELGLLLMPEVLSTTCDAITYDAYDKNTRTVIKKTEVLANVKMRFTWVDVEDGETLPQEWAGTGLNAFDKGFGSALTYGERYYLLKLFHIATDSDDVDALATTRDESIALAEAAASHLDEDTYWRAIEKHARGEKTKKGGSIRDWFENKTGASAEDMDKFDHDVENFRIANNL